MPPNPQSAIPNPKSAGVALKEQLVGGRVNEIRGGAQSVTTVSYFKGNDPSKWKGNIATYEVVDMGEVYKGIGLRLRAYGNNVEKLFTVKPGANPEQIRIRLDGIKSSPVVVETHGHASPQSHKETHINASLHDHQSIFEEGKQPPESPFIKGDTTHSPLEKGARGLSVSEHGELVTETGVGPVKFTKPIAYQEIDGKRVEIAVEYRNLSAIVECEAASITAAPNKLMVRKKGNGSVTITVTGAGGCPVEGVTVTATINGKGKRLVSVSPGTQEANASGQAIFTINAKDKKGMAVLQFKATGLDEVATARVKVR